jgi:type I restriction enzyme S subunit
MDKRKNKIPALRFPEFEGEWERKKLKQISIGGFQNGVFNDPLKIGTGYKLINVKDMYVGNYINTEELTLLNISEKEFLRNKVQFGDIFFTRSSLVKDGIAYSNINLSREQNITYDGHLIRMRPDKTKVHPIFLFYLFKTCTARSQFIVRGKTTTMTTIGQEDIATVIVVFPALPEQQKIADFLTAVDDKINQLTRRKTLLEQYKKGVMQKIFSQEIRFPEFEGEWEEKRLGNIAIFLDSKRVPLSETQRQKMQGKYPYYGASGIIDYVNDYIFDGEHVLLGEDGANIVTRSSKLAFVVDGKFWVNNHAHILKAIGSNYFLAESLERIRYEKYNTGTAQPKLNADVCKRIILYLPTLPEQQKIADFLTGIDKKIERVNTQLEKTKEWKRGLLQQMFV